MDNGDACRWRSGPHTVTFLQQEQKRELRQPIALR